MPYESQAQQRKFHADPELQQYTSEWDKETAKQKGGFKELPEKKGKPRKKQPPNARKKKPTPKRKRNV